MPYADAEIARRYRNAYARQWRAKNPEKSRLLGLRGRNRAKVNALNALGGACVVCGETDPKATNYKSYQWGWAHRTTEP